MEEIKVEKIITNDNQSLLNITKDIESIHTNAFKEHMLIQLKAIDPKTFELFGKKLLEIYGFDEVTVTSYTKDGGLDGYGQLNIGVSYLNVAFQCKRWSKSIVSRPEIDKFRGAIQGEYDQGIIFTTSTFSKDALNAARKKGAVPLILIDGKALIDIMINKEFGVEIQSIPIYINALDAIFT